MTTALPAAAPRRALPLHWIALLLVLAFAAHLRLRAAQDTVSVPALHGDSINYVSTAFNLRHFGIVSHERTWTQPDPAPPPPTALVGPGYPLLLAAVMPDRPTGQFLHDALWLQALLGVLTVGLGYLLARPLLPRWGALAVALLLALSPHLVSLGTRVLTETPFAAAVTAFAIALAHAARSARPRDYALAGVLLGVTALIRPTLQYLPLLLVPAIAWLSTNSGPRASAQAGDAGAPGNSRWRGAAALLLGFALAFGPWVVRNLVQTGTAGDPTLVTSTLLHGSYPDFMFEGNPKSLGVPYRYDPAAGSIHTPGDALHRIEANFAADPAGTARWYLLGKPVRLFDWDFVDGAGDVFINPVRRSPYFERYEFAASHRLMQWLHAPLMLLGGIGLIAALWNGLRRRDDARSRACALLAVTMAFVVALHMLGLPLSRYAVPFRAFTYLFALLALQLAWSASARWRR